MFPLLLILACSGDDTSSAGELASGDYQFWTTHADDGCLDGALEALFMPVGPEESHPFEDLIYIPAPEELPLTYEVSFREPFVGMAVTAIDGGEGRVAFTDSLIEDVLLNEALYGDCAADMIVAGELAPDETGSAGSGWATLDLQDAQGSQGRCPLFDNDPCRVELSLVAELQ